MAAELASRAPAPPPPRAPAGRRRIGSPLLLLVPVLGAYSVLLVYPLVLTLRTSLEGGGRSFREVATSPLFGPTVVTTVRVTVATTVLTVLLAYLCAMALWRASPVRRTVILGFVLLPFWTGVLVKNMAWTVLLQDSGVVNDLLAALGMRRRELLRHEPAVVIGMVHYMLPYATLPIFTALHAIDSRLERAAASLGASRAATFRRVVVPLSLPGVASAVLLVSVMCTGFFITPVLLGGPSSSMVANLVDYYARTRVEFPPAAALSMMITVAAGVLALAYQRVPREGQYGPP
jgi:ABC-type spermidine/putrescine transport system permease subunit I